MADEKIEYYKIQSGYHARFIGILKITTPEDPRFRKIEYICTDGIFNVLPGPPMRNEDAENIVEAIKNKNSAEGKLARLLEIHKG
jgi:hypothetical protein